MPKVMTDGEARYMSFPELQEALTSSNPPELIRDEHGLKSEGDAIDKAEVVKVDYDTMTRAELDALAADRGVDSSKTKSKQDVIDALRAAG